MSWLGCCGRLCACCRGTRSALVGGSWTHRNKQPLRPCVVAVSNAYHPVFKYLQYSLLHPTTWADLQSNSSAALGAKHQSIHHRQAKHGSDVGDIDEALLSHRTAADWLGSWQSTRLSGGANATLKGVRDATSKTELGHGVWFRLTVWEEAARLLVVHQAALRGRAGQLAGCQAAPGGQAALRGEGRARHVRKAVARPVRCRALHALHQLHQRPARARGPG